MNGLWDLIIQNAGSTLVSGLGNLKWLEKPEQNIATVICVTGVKLKQCTRNGPVCLISFSINPIPMRTGWMNVVLFCQFYRVGIHSMSIHLEHTYNKWNVSTAHMCEQQTLARVVWWTSSSSYYSGISCPHAISLCIYIYANQFCQMRTFQKQCTFWELFLNLTCRRLSVSPI